jgi:TIR domain
MRVIETLKRLFISHSSTDKALVDRLAADLRRKGVEVWSYFDGLTPGTPDWEAAVRNAIDQSFALLLVASPASRQSPYVRSEVLLAEAKKIPIYAVWAAGQQWIDSVPMSLAHVQYQDIRSENYDEGLRVLMKEMDRVRMTLPNHFLYKEYHRCFDDWRVLRLEARELAIELSEVRGETVYVGSKPLPDGFIAIMLTPQSDIASISQSSDAIALRPTAFACTYEMIDAIFMEYLHASYPPLTYGQTWFLRTDYDSYRRFVLPWSWITNNEPLAGWTTLMAEPPSFYGIVTGVRWTVSAKKPEYPVVLTANDQETLDAMKQMKFMGKAKRLNAIEYVPPVAAEVMRFGLMEFFDDTDDFLKARGGAGRILALKEPRCEEVRELIGRYSHKH